PGARRESPERSVVDASGPWSTARIGKAPPAHVSARLEGRRERANVAITPSPHEESRRTTRAAPRSTQGSDSSVRVAVEEGRDVNSHQLLVWFGAHDSRPDSSGGAIRRPRGIPMSGACEERPELAAHQPG